MNPFRNLASAALLLAALAPSAASAAGLVIDNVRIVDPDAASVSDPTSVAVVDGWIVDGVEAPDLRIDAGGAFLVPGLAEMHAHVPPYEATERVDDVLALFLAHGVTTIRGMLGEPGHIALRAELARGERTGPRLVTSGPSLNGNSVTTAAEARATVLRQSEAGYDFLKLHPGLRPDTFGAIDSAADGVGIGYAGHVSVGVGLDRALAAGQATIDHLDGYAQALVPADDPARQRPPGFFGIAIAEAIDAERIPGIAERTREAGVANVPTQALIEHLATADVDALLADPAMRFVDAGTKRQWAEAIAGMRSEFPEDQRRAFVEARRALIHELDAAGAVVLAGADAPQIMNVPGHSLHRELELYVESGLSPAAALATATTNVARFLGEPARGCLRPGCVADAVLLAADPLEDISAVRSVRGVVRAGEWFDRERLDAMLERVAERAAGGAD